MEQHPVRVDRATIHELENILLALFLLILIFLELLTDSELREDIKFVLTEVTFGIKDL